MLLKDFICICD